MTTNKELKPCAFCGSKMLKPCYFESVALIKCKNCGALVSFDGKESMSQTINAWNRRANNDKQ